MENDPVSVNTVSIVERAKAILLKPRETWPVIDRDATPSGEIFTRYALPLAAIGPAASFLGGQLFGFGGFWFRFRPSLLGGLANAIGSYVAGLVGIFIIAFIARTLAPKFGGEASGRSAFKLTVYSLTAAWLAGALNLIPSLGVIALILSLYSLYLFNMGAQTLLGIPREKAVGFTAVTLACVVVLALVVSAVAGTVGRVAGFGPFGAISGGDWGGRDGGDMTITVPGADVTVDTSKIEQAARNMEQAVQAGNGKTIAPADLQALLPATIGGYIRTAVESVKAGPAGSRAQGTYEAGDKRITLSVADMAAMGAMAGLGAAFGVESNQEDADGYERTTTRDGRLVVEKWRKSGSGEYATMIGQRFFIQAEGEADSIDQLKAAVASIDPGRLTALAN